MSLMSVNRAFYEVAMDEKFWEVDFTKANAKKFMEMVEMIRCVSIVVVNKTCKLALGFD